MFGDRTVTGTNELCATIGAVHINFMDDFAEGLWFASLQSSIRVKIKAERDHQTRRTFGERSQRDGHRFRFPQRNFVQR